MSELEGVSFTSSMIMEVTGKINLKPSHFFINIGHSQNDIALHFNPRFDERNDKCTIVMNSKDSGGWGTEARDTNFPFNQEQEFEVAINFDKSFFDITLPDGSTTRFQNRHGDEVYDYFSFGGQAAFYDIRFKKDPAVMAAMLR